MTTLTAPPSNLHASLVSALAGDQPEQALEQAFIRLARGGDLPLLMAMVKALTRVGLAGIAVRLLQSAGGLLTAEPQVAALVDRLSTLPSGELSPEVLRARASANLDALLGARPSLETLRHELENLNGFHVFGSMSGNTYVIRDHPSGKLDFVFPFGDQIVAAKSIKLPEVSLTTSYLMVGVPNPALWHRLLQRRMANGYLPPIDIVEPDTQILLIWLHLLERSDSLRGDRVTVCAGPDALEEYRACLIQNHWRAPLMHIMTNFRPHWRPPVLTKQFHDSIIAARQERNFRLKAELDQRCANRDREYWRHRFQTANGSSKPLRIIGFTTRFSTVVQHSMRDLAAAFQRRGCTFELVKQPNDSCAAVDVAGSLSADDFDMIVAIDHLRFEFADSIPPTVPFVGWIQDHMDQLYSGSAGKSVGGLDLVLCHSPGLMASQHGYPVQQMLATSNLTDSHTYGDQPLPEDELAPYRCDLSYVGHGAATPEELAREISAGAPAGFLDCLSRFVAAVRSGLRTQPWMRHSDRLAIALEAERASGLKTMMPAMRRRALLPAIERLYDRVIRHQTLQWVARWADECGKRFRIFGRGWEQHPTLSRFACGEIDNGPGLRRVHQASTASLHVTAYTALHQRLLDGVACGALVLTRFNPFDFRSRPHRIIRQFIERHGIDSISALLAVASRERALSEALRESDVLGYSRIADDDDPKRQREMAMWRAMYDVSEDATSAKALLEELRTMQYVPQRAACDLDGFDETVFKDEAGFRRLMDRFARDPEARREVVHRLRGCVLAHDTHDVLVERVLNFFGRPS